MNNTSWIWKKHIIALLVYDITQSQGTSWVVFVRFGGDLCTCSSGPIIICRGYLYYSLYSCQDSLALTLIHIYLYLRFSQLHEKWAGQVGRGAGWVLLYYSILWELGPMIRWHIYCTLEEGIKILSRNARAGRGGRDQIGLNIWHND